jgi:hypothetical protein
MTFDCVYFIPVFKRFISLFQWLLQSHSRSFVHDFNCSKDCGQQYTRIRFRTSTHTSNPNWNNIITKFSFSRSTGISKFIPQTVGANELGQIYQPWGNTRITLLATWGKKTAYCPQYFCNLLLKTCLYANLWSQ